MCQVEFRSEPKFVDFCRQIPPSHEPDIFGEVDNFYQQKKVRDPRIKRSDSTEAKFTANSSLNALAQKFGLDAGVKVAIAKSHSQEDKRLPDSNWVAKSGTGYGFWGR